MSDIEKAYRTLGLELGASMKEVREAHRDLCLVWDASRFKDNPQMQKKAHDQLGRIDEAFETLRDYHGGAPKTEGQITRRPPSEKNPVHPIDKAENSEKREPSLYEEIFRERQNETQPRIPIGWIIAVMMGLIVAVIYLGDPTDEDEVEGSQSAPAIEKPLEMEGSTENAGSGLGDLPLDAPQPDGTTYPTEAMVETANDPIEPARSSSVSPTDTPLKSETSSQPWPQSFSAVDTAKTALPVVELEEPEPDNKPVLHRKIPVMTDKAEEPADKDFEEDEDSNKAFEILKEKSEIVRQLIEGGGVPELSYQEWRTARRNAPEFLIDVITQRSTDRGELHLIWSVNTETGVVRPLSQAARDLESAPLPEPEC